MAAIVANPLGTSSGSCGSQRVGERDEEVFLGAVPALPNLLTAHPPGRHGWFPVPNNDPTVSPAMMAATSGGMASST